MKLRDYFNGISVDEITKRLLYLDRTMMDMHNMNLYDRVNGISRKGIFYVGDITDIEIIDGKILPESLNNKWNYLDSGFDPNIVNKNILQMCSIGLCAYNNITILHMDKDFIKNMIIDKLDDLLNNKRIPEIMKEYYIDVFYRKKIDYLNNFIYKYNDENGNTRTHHKVLVKKNNNIEQYNYDNEIESDFSKSISDRESAYAKVLILPAVLCLVILIAVVTYFIFFR